MFLQISILATLQGFAWAMNNDSWHARVGSIPRVFAAAASDLGKPAVDAEVVMAVWDRIMPGLLEVSNCMPRLTTNHGHDVRKN